MKKLKLANNIKVYCITADSFPDGVLKAHQALHALVPYSLQRKYFGLSRPENHQIIYKSAAEELEPQELEKHQLEQLIIPAGTYQTILVKEYMNHLPAIGVAFQQLTSLPDIDPDGYCVEWYLNDTDVRCMVRILP